MDINRIHCDGITVGGMEVPPFLLRSGEIICLHMPCLMFSTHLDEFLRAITGKRAIPGLRLNGKVCWAEPSRGMTGLLGRFYQPRAEDWLRRAGRISRAEAQAIVTRIGLPLGLRLSQLGGNWRLLLSIEAAWAGKTDVIVFSSSGCDPTGIRSAHLSITEKLHRCAALRLCFRDIHGRYPEEHPEGRCLEVSDKAGVSAIRNPA